MMSNIGTLYYLPMRARAEPIRMILFVGNIAYNDVTISFTEWPKHKASLDICPQGQLPTLQLPSGEIIAQSGAILRYIAKIAGFYPADVLEAARADVVQELAQDMNAINALLNFWPTPGETYIQNKEAYFKNFQRYAAYAEKLLGENAYFGGSHPHFGDFSMFHIMDASLSVDSTCLDHSGKLQHWMNAMRNIPRLGAYLQQRQQVGDLGMCGSLIQSLVPMSSSHPHHNRHK